MDGCGVGLYCFIGKLATPILPSLLALQSLPNRYDSRHGCFEQQRDLASYDGVRYARYC